MVSFPSWTRKLWTGPSTSSTLPDQSPQKKPPPFVEISIPPDPSQAPIYVQPAPSLNNTRAIPLANSPITSTMPKGVAMVPSAWYTSKNSQFELLIYPDYHPQPLRPATSGIGASLPEVFSPADYLPIDTTYLYDLIFAIRRRDKGKTGLKLKALHIEIPISRSPDASDTDDLNKNHHKPREPLLKSGDASHSGVQMLCNQRFVPSLYNGPASRIGDVRWDDMAVLGITLLPRSSQNDGTMPLEDDELATAIAVGLGECQLNPIIFVETPMAYNVPPRGGSPNWTPGPVADATKARVRLVEIYGNSVPNASSFCTVVKVRGKDKNYPDM